MIGANGGGFIARWRDNIVQAGGNPTKTLIGFTAAWLAFALILWVMPVPDGLTAQGKAVLAVMVWACIMWIFEAMPVGISGMLIPMLLVMSGGVQQFPRAASGFTTPVVFLCLAAFIFAAIMQAAGLDRRIALSLLNKMKVKTVNGVIWAMFAVNMVLSLIIPAANARAATLLPVINGITKFLGQKIAIAPIKTGSASAIEGAPLLSKDIRFLFLPNSSSLNMDAPENLKYLDTIKGYLQISPGSMVLLRGHTDNSMVSQFRDQGGETMVRNMALKAVELSKARAAEVRKALIERAKIDPKRIENVGRGWEEPAGTDSEKNRRVEVQWFTLE